MPNYELMERLERALNDVNPEAYIAYFDWESKELRVVSEIGHFASDIINELYAWHVDYPVVKIIFAGKSVDDKPMLIIA